LIILLGLLPVLAVGNFKWVDWLSLLGERDESCEILAARVRKWGPKLLLEVGDLAGEPGDGFNVHWHIGTQLGKAREVLFPVDDTVAHGGPLDFGAIRILPNG